MHIDEINSKLPIEFSLNEFQRIEDKTPFTIVLIQECRRMNKLIVEIKSSLNDLSLLLKGELVSNRDLEKLQDSILNSRIPDSWINISYSSTLTLGPWILDLSSRYNQLNSWLNDFQVPLSTWLGGLFNPQSFLIAIIQSTARKNQCPIDKMQLSVEVTKKLSENWREILQPPREGVFIHNIYLEGAKWDTNNGYLIEAKQFELFTQMPIICVKAVIRDRTDNSKDYYECPVYKTKLRNQDYVHSFNLKIIDTQNKWILSGVAILLQP